MLICPNKNLGEWKELVSTIGEVEAFRDFMEQNGEIRTLKQILADKPYLEPFKGSDFAGKVTSFLAKLNFDFKTVDDLKGHTGYSTEGTTDLLYKMVYVKRSPDIDKSIAKEAAYVAFSMLGKKNKIRTDLINSIGNLENYSKIYNKYKEASPQLSDYKIKELITVDFIADAIVNNYNVPSDSYVNRKSDFWGIKAKSPLARKLIYYLLKIKNFFDRHFKIGQLTNQEVNDLLNDIANDVLTNTMDKYGSGLSAEDQLTNYDKTIAADPRAKEIVEEMQKLGCLLSGSLSLRKQGTLYRAKAEDLHDLDFTVPSDMLQKELGKAIQIEYTPEFFTMNEEQQQEYIENAENVAYNKAIKALENLSIFKQIKKKFPSFKITTSFPGLNPGERTITGVIDDNYTIDLFFLPNFVDKSINKGFQSWESIFIAKLKMGRLKDLKDFANYVPFNPTFMDRISQEKGFRHFNFISNDLRGRKTLDDNTADRQYDESVDTFTRLSVEDAMKGSKVDPQSAANNLAVGTIGNIAKAMSDQLLVDGKALNFQFLTGEEAAAKTGRSNWDPRDKAFFVGDTVYFVGDKVNVNDVFHEFSHPFVRSIALTNPELFNKLYERIASSVEGKGIISEVKNNYTNLEEGTNYFKEEVIVKAMTKQAALNNSGVVASKTFADAIKDFLYSIKKLLRKIFGGKIDISKLDTNTKLSTLVDMLQRGEKFNIEAAVLNEQDFIAYQKERDDALDDLAKISKPDLLSLTVSGYDKADKFISRVQKNKNYEDIVPLLVDEYKRGDLQEIKRNLSKYKDQIENTLNEKKDAIAFNRAHSEAMLNTIFRLQNMIKKINAHMLDLEIDPDNIDNMHKAFYYDDFLQYWEDFIHDIIKAMDDASIPDDSELSNLVNSVRRSIESARKMTKKFYKNGARDTIYNELKYQSEALEKKYLETIANLEKRGASPAYIDTFYKEYYGLTKEEQGRKDQLEKADKAGQASFAMKKELNSLREKAMDGAQITPEKIEMALDGTYKDANIFNSFFEGYMYNTDPVVGGFALYVKNQMSDVMNNAMNKFSDYAEDMKPLLEKAGYSPDNVNELIEKVCRVELIGSYDEDGNWVEKEIWTMKSEHKGWRIALDRLKRDLDNAQKQNAIDNTDDSKKKVAEAESALSKLKREYFHQEYLPVVYAKYQLLEKDDIGIEASRRMKEALSKIENINSAIYRQMDELLVLDVLDLAWKEYRQLFSEVDLNGDRKTGMDLEVAKRLKEYRASNRDPVTGESFTEDKIRTGLFENTLAQYEQELIDNGIAKGSTEFVQKRRAWLNKNSRTLVKQEYNDQVQRLINGIDEIMSKLPGSKGKASKISSMWADITDLAATSRDDDRQVNGLDFNQDAVKFIKDKQEQIYEAMDQFDNLSGLDKQESKDLSELWDKILTKKERLSPTEQDKFDKLMAKSSAMGLSKYDKQRLYAMFASLRELKSKEGTDYYTAIVNNHLSKLNTDALFTDPDIASRTITQATSNKFLDNYIIDSLLNQTGEDAEKFKKWFLANHIEREYYDSEVGDYVSRWERIYIWNVTKPADPSFYESFTFINSDGVEETITGRMPALKFYAKVTKAKYRTERKVGVTVDNQGNWLPRLDVADSPFIDKDFTDMKTSDPAHYAVLQKMKEHHLRNQEGLPRRSRLYLDVPRFRKDNLEVLRTRRAKELGKMAAAGSLPFLTIITERVRNFFRKAKDEKGSGYKWEDDAMLVRLDMYNDEAANVPIYGLYNMPIEDVSTDLNESLMRYMFSAEKHKKLVEINPFAQALKATVNDPKNGPKDLKRIDKLNFFHRGLLTYKDKKGLYVRKDAINNFIEREFEGQTNKGWTEDMPFLNNISRMIFKRASMSFFALNFPSALKNYFGAKFQSLIETAGGKYIDAPSMTKAEGWSFSTMSQISSQIYKGGAKPLNMQIADSFDAIRGRMLEKLPESMSRTFTKDVVDLGWTLNFRKWTEGQASLQLFGGMMYKQKLKMGDKEISYMEAWEQVDNKLKLKDGIDVRWSNLPTSFVTVEGDTIDALAKKYNMSVENLQDAIGSKTIKPNREYTINNILYKNFRNKFHTVQMKLNGAYDNFDQPEAQRYLLFRFMSLMKRYFTTMFVNRWGYSGSMFNARGRMNYALGELDEGTYITVIKSAYRTFKYGTKYWGWMTPEEKGAWAKVLMEIGSIVAIMLMLPLLGWDPEDEDRFEKLRERSGALPFPYSPGDPDHPFNTGGWAMNHALMLAMSVKAENETFLPWPGLGLNSYYQTFTDVSSIGFGPTLKAYKQMVEFAYMEATGDPKARYAKDSGPYEWQKEGGSKLMTTFMKSMGFTGSTIDPITAIKNNPQLNKAGGSKE